MNAPTAIGRAIGILLAVLFAPALACVFPLVALVALLGVALLTVATHTVSLPITDPED